MKSHMHKTLPALPAVCQQKLILISNYSNIHSFIVHKFLTLFLFVQGVMEPREKDKISF